MVIYRGPISLGLTGGAAGHVVAPDLEWVPDDSIRQGSINLDVPHTCFGQACGELFADAPREVDGRTSFVTNCGGVR